MRARSGNKGTQTKIKYMGLFFSYFEILVLAPLTCLPDLADGALVAGEDVTGAGVAGEDVTGAGVAGEDVTGAGVAGETSALSATSPFSKAITLITTNQ
ncbi:hypothetical protein ACHAWO_007106 [Cyclotella atomus]|uniref:Uncharacterized protein n=1 Tax=Cyclotella atomus TaxID=382360 RepID=A0ABD3QKM8_9STRA